MTPEQQNKTIAAHCGWVYNAKVNKWIHPHEPARRLGVMNYCENLNAMHEAEKSLNPEDRRQYTMMLCDTLDAEWGLATASQRAFAFLYTLGKWEDKP